MGQKQCKQFNRIPFHRTCTSICQSIATFAFIALPLCMWAQGVHVLAIEAEASKPTAHAGVLASLPTYALLNGVFTIHYTAAQPVNHPTKDAHPAFPCANDSLNLTPIPPASIEARKHWKHRYKLGYWSYPKGMVQRAYFNAAAGSEYSTYIENPRRTPALIRRVCLVLRMWVDLIEETRPFPTVPLRLHIRAYNPQTQTPGNDLLARAVMLSRTDRKLKAWFDVRQDSIIMPPEGVCVGVEWLCSDTTQMEGNPVEPPVQVFTGGTDGQSWECSNGDTWQPLRMHNAASTPVNMRIGIEVLQ